MLWTFSSRIPRYSLLSFFRCCSGFRKRLRSNQASLYKLRDYQHDFVERVLEVVRPIPAEFLKTDLLSHLPKNRPARLLAVLPTGSGKTVCFSHIAKQLLPKRTLIIAHRLELLSQAQITLYKATGIVAELEMAEHVADLSANLVVASIQSLAKTDRLQRIPKDHFSLIIVDEVGQFEKFAL